MAHAHYHVAYIAGSRMPQGRDWIHFPDLDQPLLVLRAGVDERRAFLEVVEMLAARADDDRAACRQVA